MAKGPKLTIAGYVYGSKAAVLQECSRILNDGEIGSIVCGAHSEFVEELWLNRPDKHAEHPGKRIVRFERRMQAGAVQRTRCFWAVFDDGTATDFSYQKAVANIARNHREGAGAST